MNDFICKDSYVAYNDSEISWIINNNPTDLNKSMNGGFYIDADTNTYCLCSTFYGFEGVNCDEYSTTTKIWISGLSCVTILCVISMILNLHVFSKVDKQLNAKTATLALLFTGNLMIGISTLIFDVELSETMVQYPGAIPNTKYLKSSFLKNFLAGIGVVFIANGLMNVALNWLTVVDKTLKMKKVSKERRLGIAKQYTYFIYFFEITLAIAYLVCISVFSVAFGIVAVFFHAIAAALIFGTAGLKLTALIQQTGTDAQQLSPKMIRTYKNVQKTSLEITFTMIILFIFMGVYAYSNVAISWEEASPPGQVNIHCWSISGVLFTITLIGTYPITYINRSLQANIDNSSAPLSTTALKIQTLDNTSSIQSTTNAEVMPISP